MRYLLLLCCLLMTTLLADSAAPDPMPPLAAQWKKIDALLAKDQTASAAPLVERLYQQARRAGNAPAYVRALLYKIRLLERKQNDATEKAIALLEADVKTAAFPARPILHSLLAGLYTNYFDQHRYQLYARTAGAAPTADAATAGAADGGTSLATWDARRLGATILRHYYASVNDEPQRQLETTLAELGDLTTGGNAEGRALRPTLYDLLAHRAIEGLQNQELTVTQPEHPFALTDYPAAALFGPAARFAALPLPVPAADSLSHQLHALRLLQQLTAQRLKLPQPAALADVDLARLDYLHDLTRDTDLAAAYEPALTQLAATYAALPISTEFILRQAQAQHETHDEVAAVRLARLAEARFPQSAGAARARELRREIEQPALAFEAAEVVVPGQPWRLDVTARNVTKLHLWAYRITLQEWAKADDYDERPLARRYARALRAAPVAAWTELLPAEVLATDYKEHKIATGGAALPAGYYLVVVSSQAASPTAPRAGQVTAYGVVGASELSALSATNGTTRQTQLLVLHRQSGQLLPGVRVQPTYHHYQDGKEVQLPGTPLATNEAGEATLPTPLVREELGAVRLARGRDTLLLRRDPTGHYRQQPAGSSAPRQRDFLFTDRAIYRPGQTLYFKGILTQTQGGNTRLLTQQAVSVRLLDANSQTVQTLSFTSSAYGSFNGSLVLPAGLLNGEFSLRTDHGETEFAVEDYKRPTFEVRLDSVPGRPQLGQPLAVSGRARAYAGQPTDGATVAYRVTRRELWPLFDYGFRGGRGSYPPGGRSTREVAHGTATTDAEGRFSFTFTPPLAPGQPGRGGYQPGYLFEVTADVTDAAGETRSATRSFPIGPNPLSLSLTGPDLLNKRQLPTVNLLATNATGEALPAAGTLRLLARRFRPNPPGVAGPAPETDDNELPPTEFGRQFFDTKAGAALDLAALLGSAPTGRYRLEAQAAGPDSARAHLDFVLYDAQAATVPFATPDWVVLPADTVAPNQPATLLLGSSEPSARVLLEVERAGQVLRREWLTLAAGEQRRLSIASGPAAAAGPLYVHTTQVRDNHLYQHDFSVQVAAPRPPLRLSIATFRDRLQPGQRETWRVTIHQAGGAPAEAELLATLYDQSLDLFRPHAFQPLEISTDYYPPLLGWAGEFGETRSEGLTASEESPDAPTTEYPALNDWQLHLEQLRYPAPRLRRGIYSRTVATVTVKGNTDAPDLSPLSGRGDKMVAEAPAPMAVSRKAGAPGSAPMLAGRTYQEALPPTPPAGGATTQPDLGTVPTRRDFRETAFWQPALHTDQNGDVVLEFQMPEAVTRWQLLALAHDQNLRTGQLARQLVTQKEIQLTPNAPRFLRPGDSFAFAAKFSNLTGAPVGGTAQLVLLDAATGQDVTSQLLPGPAQQPVQAAAHQSQALSWALTIPADFAPVAVTYRVVAQAGAADSQKSSRKKARQASRPPGEEPGGIFSDGEENTLPVLPNRILITESLPLPVVGPGTRAFELRKLTSTSSATRRNQGLTLEMTSNPAWYAVQSLPYLLEYPYECSEQVFSRLYGNLLAAQIIKSNPRIKPILAEWQRQAQSGPAAQQSALASKLTQNQDLKNLLLQETPWVQDAQSETERLARLSTLFDEARLSAETTRALTKLRAMQLPDGSFPWFEKMPADRYITQLIVAGLGKLRTLGALDASQDAAARPLLQAALGYLDRQLAADYTQLRQEKNVQLTADHLSDLQIQALYARSYWPQPAVSAASQPAATYYRGQATRYWAGRTRYLQAQIALVLHRQALQAGGSDKNVAAFIMLALTENALHSPELGMYWQDVQPGPYWREAPTETQATLIEAYSEIEHNPAAVDELKLWLLRQKQTQHWESTRATADACYALLLRGTDWLAAPAAPVQVAVGGPPLPVPAAQAGTGYFAHRWAGPEVQPTQGQVTVTKPGAGVAWGALYWQYFEDLDKVTPAATPLSLERQLYREVRTAAGPTLAPLTAASPLQVGNALVVRLVLRTDRALEYVHLKDQRAAGLEPISQLSGYRTQGGLGYYESPRDAATHFFLSAVPRGTHVFEYRLRASQAGDFSGGLSEVQCLYAPEFRAHSAGQRLTIK